MFWRDFLRYNRALYDALRIRAARWTQSMAGVTIPFLGVMLEEYALMIPGHNIVLDAPSWTIIEQNLRQQITRQAATIDHLGDMHPDRICIACVVRPRVMAAIPCGISATKLVSWLFTFLQDIAATYTCTFNFLK